MDWIDLREEFGYMDKADFGSVAVECYPDCRNPENRKIGTSLQYEKYEMDMYMGITSKAWRPFCTS